MKHSLIWFHPPVWVPSKASCDEIEESFIIAFECLLQSLRAWSSSASLGRNCDAGLAHGIKEQFLPAALLNQVLLWRPEDFHDTCKLFLFIFAREDRIACQKLGQNTAQTPHVDRKTISHTQNDLRGSVETGLDVRVHFFVLEAARAEVDDLDLGVKRVRK